VIFSTHALPKFKSTKSKSTSQSRPLYDGQIMTVQIVEILGRSKQGFTEPFICRGDDDQIYFVKGKGAGRRSQVFEWIAGNLAIELELPIAPFLIVDVPEELIEGNPAYTDLGVGPAFGSLKQMITELNYAGIGHVPVDIQRAVLAFDWWIRNEDRHLTESGGNPNLFWDPEYEKLVVIDHNQAFDPDFSTEDFKELHVFSGMVNGLFGDALYRVEFDNKFQLALKSWQEICDNIPEEWYYADPEMTVRANFELNDI